MASKAIGLCENMDAAASLLIPLLEPKSGRGHASPATRGIHPPQRLHTQIALALTNLVRRFARCKGSLNGGMAERAPNFTKWKVPGFKKNILRPQTGDSAQLALKKPQHRGGQQKELHNTHGQDTRGQRPQLAQVPSRIQTIERHRCPLRGWTEPPQRSTIQNGSVTGPF